MSTITASPSPDPEFLDPTALRIPSGARTNAVRRVVASTLTISKPRPDDWVTIHPDPSFHWESFWVYEKDKQFYLLVPDLYDQLEVNIQRVFAECDFYLTAVRNDDPIVWFSKHSDTEYFRTRRCAIEAAMTGWIQIQSNQALKQYEHRRPHADYEQPDWPNHKTADDASRLFTELFRRRLITSLDHEVLERIRGRK